MSELKLEKEYVVLLNQLKDKIKTTQFRAVLAVNQEVIGLYWHIGQQIIKKQQEAAWGTKLIETLALDLQHAFPETHGFSIANLKRMKRFAEEYPEPNAISAQAVRQLPWGHIITLMQKIKSSSERDWYGPCVRIVVASK
jgi:predicted nuclease of restriction endonuclease-like (RecB) superfamily